MAETLQDKITKAQAGLILSKLDEVSSDALADHEDRVASVEGIVATAGVAGLAALLSAGLGASVLYDHADDVGANVLVAADADADRAVIVVARIDEEIAADTNKAKFQIGETGTAGKFLTVGLAGINSADGTEGAVYVGAGVLAKTKNLLVTVADGTGGNETGKLLVTVLLLPTGA